MYVPKMAIIVIQNTYSAQTFVVVIRAASQKGMAKK